MSPHSSIYCGVNQGCDNSTLNGTAKSVNLISEFSRKSLCPKSGSISISPQETISWIPSIHSKAGRGGKCARTNCCATTVRYTHLCRNLPSTRHHSLHHFSTTVDNREKYANCLLPMKVTMPTINPSSVRSRPEGKERSAGNRMMENNLR